MSKFNKCVARRDVKQDHAHKMEEGQISGGMLGKPNANARAGWHTHLYEDEGEMKETKPEYDDGDHVHEDCMGRWTSGPMALPKHVGEELGRNDSIEREGEEYVVRSETKHELKRSRKLVGLSKEFPEAVSAYQKRMAGL